MASAPKSAAVIPFSQIPTKLNAHHPDPRYMPSNTLALDLPKDMALPDWLAMGRSLASQRRTIDWLLGDWLAFGREHFPAEQIEMALGDVTNDPRSLRRVEKVAKIFPAHLRNEALTFDHHAKVADLPVQEALPLLKRASDEKLTPGELRREAYIRKMETGQLLPREDDPEDDALLACVRAWNRAPLSVRQDFAEMVADSDFGDIEP